MRQVPFYANHDDGMRCMLAVYRSILDYFIHRKMSWDELEAFTGYQPGRAAWSIKSLVHFAAMGFDIRMIEPFDYRRYEREGMAYLETYYTAEKLSWYINNSNIMDIRPQLAEFLATVDYECRRPTLDDIDNMLHEGRLVSVSVNGRVLDNAEGFSSHVVLVIDKQGGDYIVHDSGGDPTTARQNHRIPAALVWQAMGAENSTSEVTGFKLKDRRNIRLDQFVIQENTGLSRAYAVRLINDGKVLVNGKPNKAGYKVRELDDVTIDYDENDVLEVPDIDLSVLYEDDDCIVINKPTGVLTHSVGKLAGEATVASFLRSRLSDADGPDPDVVGIRNAKVNADNVRAGIVHRLDRATSGVIICAKTPQALAWLQKQFHDRQAKKVYAAVVKGRMDPPEAVIDMPIERNPKAPATFRVGANGKSARTRYKMLESNETYSLLELKPETGRTHQLRVHLANQGHPIVGDYMYGGEKADRLFLHAESLELTVPDGTRRRFEAPLPPEFTARLGAD